MVTALIVDDDISLRCMIKEVLADDGMDVLEASNGDEALAAIKDKPVDLVITDLIMPHKNGIDLILEMRNTHPMVNVIAISGQVGLNSRFNFLPVANLVGAHRVMEKPFSPRDLRATIGLIFNSGGKSKGRGCDGK